MGYDVTEHVGKYENPQWTAYGVVAVLRNGSGPTVLVRTELDALPVEEKTGLPYASKVKADQRRRQGGLRDARLRARHSYHLVCWAWPRCSCS